MRKPVWEKIVHQVFIYTYLEPALEGYPERSMGLIKKNSKKCEPLPFQPINQRPEPETHIKRQATRHDCLPGLLGDGDK